MGVNELWNVIANACTKKDIDDLKSEKVAVDLATWICEAEGVESMKSKVVKSYLRNLLFRVIKLTSSGLDLIFVADGRPPELKQRTIVQRINARQTGQSSNVFTKAISRSGLNRKLNECCNMLDILGIPWLKSEGEAEATCAALNMKGIVDACATSDGDAFLYGATKVYRNLKAEKKNKISCYKMADIEEKLRLNRNDLISLGLLLGCDYDPGVRGVGKDRATKWLFSFNGNSLERMRQWKEKSADFRKSDDKKPTHCSFCKHIGSKKEHARYHCSTCIDQCLAGEPSSMNCKCDWHARLEKKKETEAEDKIVKLARKTPGFPNENVIKEFTKERVVEEPKASKTPSLSSAVDFVSSKLEWTKKYTLDTILPLFTCRILSECIDSEEVIPKKIVKGRVHNFVPVYEMEWSVRFVASDLSTLERRDLVKKRFPHLVDEFQKSLEADKKKKKPKAIKIKMSSNNSKLTDFYQKTKEASFKREKSSTDTEINLITASASKLALTPAVDVSSDDVITFQEASNEPMQCELKCTNGDETDLIVEKSGNCAILSPSRQKLDFSSDLFDSSSCTSEVAKENQTPISNVNGSKVSDDSPVFLSLTERIRLRNINY